MEKWEFTLERYAGGWHWKAKPVGTGIFYSYSGWCFTKFGAKSEMKRVAKRTKKEQGSKESWVEEV